MDFIVMMLGMFIASGGLGLVGLGSSQGNTTLFILGGIVMLLGGVLGSYGWYLRQNRMIDRLRGDR